MWAGLGDLLDNRMHSSDLLRLPRLNHRKPPSFCLGLLECSLGLLPLGAQLPNSGKAKYMEKPCIEAPVNSPTERPADSPYMLLCEWAMWDVQLSRAFRWQQPQPLCECNCLRESKWDLSPINTETWEIIAKYCFKPLRSGAICYITIDNQSMSIQRVFCFLLI